MQREKLNLRDYHENQPIDGYLCLSLPVSVLLLHLLFGSLS